MTTHFGQSALSGSREGCERVLGAVKHALAEGRYAGGMLPSYRQLARELHVTVASVERAMAQLEREGLVRREQGRGTLPLPQQKPVGPQKPYPLECINILTYTPPFLPSFVESDYLRGYTEALDCSPNAIRVRFVTENDYESCSSRLFSPVVPMAAQGVVFVNSCPTEIMEQLQRGSVPFVVQYYARYVAKGLPPHFSVYVNKSGGAFQAVNHLLELGHRNIGFIGLTEPDTAWEKVIFDGYRSGTERVFEGYRAALNCAGMECDEANLINCDHFTIEKQEVFDIAKSLLGRPNRPTAVLASCDEFALSLIDAARALNLRVPEDVSVVGFDNQPMYKPACPRLTTVSVPRRELANSAIQLLLELAEKPDTLPQRRILETHLIIRETTAPPRAIYANNSTDGHLYCS